MSAISLYFINPALDRVIAVGQAFLIFGMCVYFMGTKLTKFEELKLESNLSLLWMIVSFILSLLALHLTKALAYTTGNSSVLITSSHFQIDVVLKVCVIVIYLIQMSKLQAKIKNLWMIILDLIGVLYGFLASGTNLLGVIKDDLFLSQFLHLFVSFIIGSIPFSVILPLFFFNIKITEFGSKNPGATNVHRVLMTRTRKSIATLFTVLVALLDLGKGILPGYLFPEHASAASLIAVLGHMYSPFLMFKGGKGVATFLGAIFGTVKSYTYLAPALVWFMLTNYKNTLFSFLPVQIAPESLIWRNIKIKQSFFITLVTLIYGIILILYSPILFYEKMRFLIIFGIIYLKHDSHVEQLKSKKD
jgi:acyl-phosphate glycerol 3-phosphate acyltransferase